MKPIIPLILALAAAPADVVFAQSVANVQPSIYSVSQQMDFNEVRRSHEAARFPREKNIDAVKKSVYKKSIKENKTEGKFNR